MQESLVYVYKSSNKVRSYLYLKEKDAFAAVPGALLDAFGSPKFVMVFALGRRKTLPKITPEKLQQALNEKGYFLRLDLEDAEENLLNEERRRLGLPPLEKDAIQDFFH